MRVIEGTWEEVLAQAKALEGKRVRLVVLDAVGGESAESEERLQVFREMISYFRQNPPVGTVGDEALRRENIYEDRI